MAYKPLPTIEAKQPVLKCYPTPEGNKASIIDSINRIRQDNDLPPLKHDSKLDSSATKKAEDMAKRKYFAHKDPDGNMAWGLIEGSGYQYNKAGENLSKNLNNIKSVDRWLQSKSHMENILDPDWTDVGVGGSDIYNVLHYGKRK